MIKPNFTSRRTFVLIYHWRAVGGISWRYVYRCGDNILIQRVKSSVRSVTLRTALASEENATLAAGRISHPADRIAGSSCR